MDNMAKIQKLVVGNKESLALSISTFVVIHLDYKVRGVGNFGNCELNF